VHNDIAFFHAPGDKSISETVGVIVKFLPGNYPSQIFTGSYLNQSRGVRIQTGVSGKHFRDGHNSAPSKSIYGVSANE
jgi:hypothetical protein